MAIGKNQNPQTYSYRSIISYWALHNDLSKTEQGHTVVYASISFPDTKGIPTGT